MLGESETKASLLATVRPFGKEPGAIPWRFHPASRTPSTWESSSARRHPTGVVWWKIAIQMAEGEDMQVEHRNDKSKLLMETNPWTLSVNRRVFHCKVCQGKQIQVFCQVSHHILESQQSLAPSSLLPKIHPHHPVKLSSSGISSEDLGNSSYNICAVERQLRGLFMTVQKNCSEPCLFNCGNHIQQPGTSPRAWVQKNRIYSNGPA